MTEGPDISFEDAGHRFDADGFCIYCGAWRGNISTKSCPMSPEDDGLAYLNEVDEP